MCPSHVCDPLYCWCPACLPAAARDAPGRIPLASDRCLQLRGELLWVLGGFALMAVGEFMGEAAPNQWLSVSCRGDAQAMQLFPLPLPGVFVLWQKPCCY